MTLARLLVLRILLLVLLHVLLLLRILLLARLAKNRDELPLVVLLAFVVNLDGIFAAVRRDSDDSTARDYGRAVASTTNVRQRSEQIVCSARLLPALLRRLLLLTELLELLLLLPPLLKLLLLGLLLLELLLLLPWLLLLLKLRLASLLLGLLLSRLLCRIVLPLPELLRISKQRLVIHVLRKQLGSYNASIGIDGDKPELFSRDRIFVGLSHEPQVIGRDQLIDRTRINTELALILLNRPSVLFAAEDQLFFELALGLHLICGNARCDENRSGGCKENQSSE